MLGSGCDGVPLPYSAILVFGVYSVMTLAALALLPDVPPTPTLSALRSQMHEVVVGARAAGPAWATGIALLDAALGGGIPRGRITEVVGAMAAGKAAMLRQVVTRVLSQGGWVAWVDARRTLSPQPWAGLGTRLVMVRPHDHKRGAWCADVLLRSGVFALVVLDGAPLLSRVNGVRLAQLARERDAAFVVIADGTQASRVGGAVRLRIQACVVRRRSRDDSGTHGTRDAIRDSTARGFSVIVEKGGAYRTVEVNRVVVVACRMCADPEIPDRRGVARGTRHAWAPRSGPHTESNQSHSLTWGGLGASVGDVHATGAARDSAARDNATRDSAARTGAARTDNTTPPALPREHADGRAHAHGSEHGSEHAHARGSAPERDHARDERDLDKRTRDWTNYRGRRRAADPDYGRHSRRALARERTDTILGAHSGQSRGIGETPRLGRDGRTGRIGSAEHALGRPPAGAR